MLVTFPRLVWVCGRLDASNVYLKHMLKVELPWFSKIFVVSSNLHVGQAQGLQGLQGAPGAPGAQIICIQELTQVFKHAKRHGQTCLIIEADLLQPHAYTSNVLDLCLQKYQELGLTIVFVTQFKHTFPDFMQRCMDDTHVQSKDQEFTKVSRNYFTW